MIEGVASVDESAITGESAPVIRESGGDFSSVTGGTRVLSDWLVVRVTANPGESFLDRMIAMVESARRQKTPNEIALTILLVKLTLVFLFATVTLLPFSIYSVAVAGRARPVTITVLVALLVCLIPTTIGGLLSAIGIAGIDRMLRANVIAMSGRAVEAAGDVDVLLLDKTGTITLGNRQAAAFVPAPGVTEQELADAAQLASLADETPEGRSIVVLAKQKYGIRERDIEASGATFVPFTAQTRMSGVESRRAARSAKARPMRSGRVRQGHRAASTPQKLKTHVDNIARRGGTPLVVAEGDRVLGVIELKDIVKGGIKERFAQLRRMGIKTVMITGDNPLTAAAIAAEAGVDDFLAAGHAGSQAEADSRVPGRRPPGGHDRRRHQRRPGPGPGRRGGRHEHRHAGRQGSRQHGRPRFQSDEADRDRRDRQAAADDARFAHDLLASPTTSPSISRSSRPRSPRRIRSSNALNVMRLTTPNSAILSAVIFNALIIVALIPLALRGVKYRAVGAAPLLRDNLLIYGVGGLIVPVHRHQGHRHDPRRPRTRVIIIPRRRNPAEETMITQFRPAFVLLIAITLVTGIVYPLLVTGVSQLLFSRSQWQPDQEGRQAVGSTLLGQPSPTRTSGATRSATGRSRTTRSSNGLNHGPTNPTLSTRLRTRRGRQGGGPDETDDSRRSRHGSGSGLDPHIYPAAAEYQVARVARTRGMTFGTGAQLIAEYSQGSRTLGLLGEPHACTCST